MHVHSQRNTESDLEWHMLKVVRVGCHPTLDIYDDFMSILITFDCLCSKCRKINRIYLHFFWFGVRLIYILCCENCRSDFSIGKTANIEWHPYRYVLKTSTSNQINLTSGNYLSRLFIISIDLQKVSKNIASLYESHKISGRDEHIQ